MVAKLQSAQGADNPRYAASMGPKQVQIEFKSGYTQLLRHVHLTWNKAEDMASDRSYWQQAAAQLMCSAARQELGLTPRRLSNPADANPHKYCLPYWDKWPLQVWA